MSVARSLGECAKSVTLEQETVVNPNPVKSWSIAFWVPDGVRSFQDSRELVSLVSLSLLVKVVMPPGAWASSVSAVSIKNCGAASTENVKLAPFEMVISIGWVAWLTYAHTLCFSFYTVSEEDADRKARNKRR